MRCWLSCASGIFLAFSDLMHTCTGSRRSCGLFGTTLGRALCGICFSLSRCFSAVVLSLFFCSPPTTHSFFFSFHCYHRVMGARMSLCGGGLMAGLGGITSHGKVLLSRGWLITVEAPARHGHPTSTQLGVVVKYNKIEKKKKKKKKKKQHKIQEM